MPIIQSVDTCPDCLTLIRGGALGAEGEPRREADSENCLGGLRLRLRLKENASDRIEVRDMDGRDDEPVTVSGSRAYGARYELLSDSTKDFSLVCGGPLYKFFLRIGLVKPPLHRSGWRMVVITLIAWAPLLLLAILSGCLVSGVRVPFLYDIDTQVRLLVVLPVLIAAEVAFYQEIRILVPQFVEQQIITPVMLPKFEAFVQSAARLKDSAAAESGLLALVIIVGTVMWRGLLGVHTGIWYSSVSGANHTLSPAGYWYVFVSLPIVEFICLRWYLRVFLWARLLWQISRMDLNLVASHPDRHCGLGFLEQIVKGVAPFIVAHSILVFGFVAEGVLHDGMKLPHYRMEIAGMAVFLFLLALGPLFVFTPKLIDRGKTASLSYGSLASDYVNKFERKWILGQHPDDEPLIGTADIQSLADLSNSFGIVQHIVPVPFGKETMFYLVSLIALPLLPLLLTMFSVQELVERLLKVLF